MGKILLNAANITCNNKRETDLKAYMNNKLINTLNFDSKEIIMEYADTDFLFLIEENMESSDSISDISLMREVRQFAKRYKDISLEEKFNEFEEAVSNTSLYLQNMEQTGEIPQTKRQVASALISYDKALLINSDSESSIYISGGNVVNLFEQSSEGVVQSVQINSLKTDDIIILLSDTISKSVSVTDILDRITNTESAESIAQSIASFYSSKNNEEFSVIVILVKLIQDKAKTLMRSEIDLQQIEKFEDTGRYTMPVNTVQFKDTAQRDDFWDTASQDIIFTDREKKVAKNSSFDSIKLSKNESRKRRTSIYIKRAISAILVLALMAALIFGMVKILGLILNKTPKESTSPPPVHSPIVVDTPTPTPTPTLTPPPEESIEPSSPPVEQYITHIILVTTDHNTLGAIARYYNDTYKLNYPNLEIFIQIIVGLNELENPNMIYAGQELQIPITPVP